MLIQNDMGEFVDDFDPYGKRLLLKHVGPNDREPRQAPRPLPPWANARCRWCGEPFRSVRKGHVYCCDGCRSAAHDARRWGRG